MGRSAVQRFLADWFITYKAYHFALVTRPCYFKIPAAGGAPCTCTTPKVLSPSAIAALAVLARVTSAQNFGEI